LLSFGAECFVFQFAIKKYKDIQSYNFAVVFYGCKTWSLAFREERRLKVLRRIFGTEGNGVTRQRRKLHNEELNDLYCSPNIVQAKKSRCMR
jgi:hypothetical protein